MPKVTITKKKTVKNPFVFSDLEIGSICQFRYAGSKTTIIGIVINIGNRMEPKKTFMPVSGAGGSSNQDSNFMHWGDIAVDGLSGKFLPMDDVKITLEN